MSKEQSEIDPPVNSRGYYFPCSCGCGSWSDNLGRDYMRLSEGCKFYLEGHTELSGVVLKNGLIVREGDF